MSTILKWDGQSTRECKDALAVEEPLEIRVRGRAISVTMRTPGHDAELAAGFLLTEGIVREPRDIVRVEHCGRNEEDNVLNVVLAPHVHVDFDKLTRHVFASSSCGLCGKATIDAVKSQFPPIQANDLRVDLETIARLPDQMRAAQTTFDQTGGLHAAALFADDGAMHTLREDIGRHNAVDKVVGHCLMNDIDTSRAILLVSGRSSFEIMQKALAGARADRGGGLSAVIAGSFVRPRKRTNAYRVSTRSSYEYLCGRSAMQDVTLAVLAGGEGRRMGRPKAELRIDGQPILERLLDRLDWRGPTLLVTARGRERPPGAERFGAEILDEVSGEGPLRGIMTALLGADRPIVVIVPVDMPNLSREPLEWMVRQLTSDGSAATLMLRRAGEIEPLPAVLRICLAQSIIRARLASGQRSIHSLSDEPSTRVQSCPIAWHAALWTNLNTPEDLSLHV